jgi:tripartite-type tricarboxylate transporter receptor subunit TctC
MNLARRDVLRLAALTGAGLAVPGNAFTRTWPERPARIVVPFAPGGIDLVFRLFGQALSTQLGQQFYIENAPGAGGNIGTGRVKQAPADGYALLGTGPGFIINAALNDKLPYDALGDFNPVTVAATTTLVLLINPSVGVGSLKDLVELVKANPGKYSYASAGVGTLPHLTGELLKQSIGLDIVHVPYNSAGQVMGSVIAGHTPMCLAASGPAAGSIREGKVRALAVASTTRWQGLPEVPTTAEAGYPGVECEVWCGLLAPAGTPREVVTLLHRETANALVVPEVKERLAALGYVGSAITPEQFGEQLRAELARWTKVIRTAGIKPQAH